MDYLLHVDGEKAGLWKGLFVDVHGEQVYGTSINSVRRPGLLPVSLAQSLPNGPNSVTAALTGVKFTQSAIRKLRRSSGERSTHSTALTSRSRGGGSRRGWGPRTRALLCSTRCSRERCRTRRSGLGLHILKNLESPVLSLTVFDTNNTPTTSGFNTFFDNGVTLVPAINIPTQFFGLPGHQEIWARTAPVPVHDHRQVVVHQPNPGRRHATEQVRLMVNGVTASTRHSTLPRTTRNGRGGHSATWASRTRTPARSGGLGASVWAAADPLPCRKLDSFGIGYFYLGVNDSLKNLAPRVFPIRDEHGVEMFYNVGVTPWFHITPDLQVVLPGQRAGEQRFGFGSPCEGRFLAVLRLFGFLLGCWSELASPPATQNRRITGRAAGLAFPHRLTRGRFAVAPTPSRSAPGDRCCPTSVYDGLPSIVASSSRLSSSRYFPGPV